MKIRAIVLSTCIVVFLQACQAQAPQSAASAMSLGPTESVGVSAAESYFVSVTLPRGVDLQLPKGWLLLTAEHKQLINMSAEAALDLSGISVAEGAEVNLIAAKSMPQTMYAAVNVDSITPASASPSVISSLTSFDIQTLQAGIHTDLRKLLPQQDRQLLAFFGVRRVTISGHPTLITEYRRSGPKGPVIVRIIQIFTPSQEIKINLSYRESEQAIWKPVTGKIYKSIVIRRWP